MFRWRIKGCNLGNAYRSAVAGEITLWNYTLNMELNVAAGDFPEHCQTPMTGVPLLPEALPAWM